MKPNSHIVNVNKMCQLESFKQQNREYSENFGSLRATSLFGWWWDLPLKFITWPYLVTALNLIARSSGWKMEFAVLRVSSGF